MKSFRLAKKQLVSPLINAALISAILLFAAATFIYDDGHLGLTDAPFAILCWAAICTVWYVAVFRQVIEIKVKEDGSVEFKRWIGCRTVKVTDIESIDSEYFSRGIIRVHHTGGTIRLMYNIDGLHDFIGTMKSLNPRIRTFDC